jgi:hypothetical protein
VFVAQFTYTTQDTLAGSMHCARIIFHLKLGQLEEAVGLTYPDNLKCKIYMLGIGRPHNLLFTLDNLIV